MIEKKKMQINIKTSWTLRDTEAKLCDLTNAEDEWIFTDK